MVPQRVNMGNIPLRKRSSLMPKDSTMTTGRASLCALGEYLKRQCFFAPLREQVEVPQKMVRYRPIDKLLDGLLGILCGAKTISHSTQFSGGVCPHSSKAARGEDLQVEHPVWCGDVPAFHFHATLAGMLRPTLIGDQVIEVRQLCYKCLLSATEMVKAF